MSCDVEAFGESTDLLLSAGESVAVNVVTLLDVVEAAEYSAKLRAVSTALARIRAVAGTDFDKRLVLLMASPAALDLLDGLLPGIRSAVSGQRLSVPFDAGRGMSEELVGDVDVGATVISTGGSRVVLLAVDKAQPAP
jgi:hypothetical protein